MTNAAMTNWKNVNNWHWVDKNCMPWTLNYFKKLEGIRRSVESTTVEVCEVTSVQGDCDLNQRKGQIIHIFDVELKLKWKAQVGDSEGKGTIFMPEFMHDTEPDDIVFEINVDSDVKDKDTIKNAVRTQLVPLIREGFKTFHVDLMDAHAKDVYITDEEMKGHPISNTYKPKPPVPEVVDSMETGNTEVKGGLTSITDDTEFQCSAQELYDVILDRQRVQMWTRAPAQLENKVGAAFVLFGGNITGSFTKLVSYINYRFREN